MLEFINGYMLLLDLKLITVDFVYVVFFEEWLGYFIYLVAFKLIDARLDLRFRCVRQSRVRSFDYSHGMCRVLLLASTNTNP